MKNLIKKIKEEIFYLVKKKPIFIIFFGLAFLIGTVLAIINLFAYREVLSFKNLINSNLFSFLKGNINLFSYFFRNFFVLILVFISVFLVNFNKYFSYIFFALMVYFSYILIFNAGIIIFCFGFFGIIFSFVYFLIINLLYLLIFFILYLFFYFSNKNNRYLCEIKQNCIFPLFLFCLIIILNILETILLPLFSSTFIIVFV